MDRRLYKAQLYGCDRFFLDNWNIKHQSLRCKFLTESHSAEYLRKEILQILGNFGFMEKDTPIVTDAGSNIVAALNEKLRFQCMTHRLSTIINDAWERAVEKNTVLQHNFDSDVRNLISYVKRTTGIQEKLTVTINSHSDTRAWRGLDAVHSS